MIHGAGDGGSTGIRGQTRLPKDHPRIECLGVLDELNAFLGDARTALSGKAAEILRAVQEELFSLAAAVAAGPDSGAASASPVDLDRLEGWIAELEAAFPVEGFSLPGATAAQAKLHIARAQSRRAERRFCALARLEAAETETAGAVSAQSLIPYLNRLSTLLFMLALSEEKTESGKGTINDKNAGASGH